MKNLCFALMLLASALTTHAADKIPLFQNDDIIKMVIKTDFPFRNAAKLSDDEKFEAEINYQWRGEKFEEDAKIKIRGKSRRQSCNFAPFKLILKGDMQDTLFESEDNDFKVVSHCDEEKNMGQNHIEISNRNLLAEYSMYKILEALGNPAFSVRLFEIKYQTLSGKLVANRLAFMVESPKDIVARTPSFKSVFDADQFFHDENKSKAEKEKVLRALNAKQELKHTLGQLLILNTDWTDTFGNIHSFLRRDETYENIHYDFDTAKFVGRLPMPESAYRSHAFQSKPTISSDLNWLKIYPEFYARKPGARFTAGQLTQEMKNAVTETIVSEHAVLDAIQAALLDDVTRQELMNRAEIFFSALKAF